MKQHVATIMWDNRDEYGHEYCTLTAIDNGYLFQGAALLQTDGIPRRVHYQITADSAWQTRTFNLTMWAGPDQRMLVLRADEQQRWWEGEKHLTAFDGLFDIDLSLTPATNTLAIMRLNLDIGASAETTTVWVDFPSLEVKPFPQRYTRRAENTYLFESLKDDFKAELRLNEYGLVADYQGLWKQTMVYGGT